MINGFTKLWGCIITSSVWGEDSDTRIVWITLLSLSDWDGNVMCSVPGLAHTARVSRESCEKALYKFMSADTDSRSQDYDGRRIEKIDGGYKILNFEKYRKKANIVNRREYQREYMEKYRQKKSD